MALLKLVYDFSSLYQTSSPERAHFLCFNVIQTQKNILHVHNKMWMYVYEKYENLLILKTNATIFKVVREYFHVIAS